LQVENLQVHFPIRKGILQRVKGQVQGSGWSIAGNSAGTYAGAGRRIGCGKTTLGKALLQLITPTAGSVRLDGHELTGLSARELRTRRAAIQMVFRILMRH